MRLVYISLELEFGLGYKLPFQIQPVGNHSIRCTIVLGRTMWKDTFDSAEQCSNP